MATYLPLQKQYIPTLEPFTPDYGFLGDVLQKRQDRYDHNYELLNDAYGRLINTPLSREGNIEVRDQYAKDLSNKMKQVSGLDLSLGKNVEAAKALFRPFYENDNIIKDMVFTKQAEKEMNKMQSYLYSDNEEEYSKFWDIGAEDLQYKIDKFKNGSAEEAYNEPLPKYVNNADIYGRALEIFEKYPLSIKHTDVNGDWKFEMENGALLLEETVGYDNEGNPVKRSPAKSHLYQMLLRDPQVGLALRTEAEVMGRRFANDPNNQQQYGGYDGAIKEWANKTIGKSVPKQTHDMTTSDNYIKILRNNLTSWNEYQQQFGITPEEQKNFEQQMTELDLLESTRKMQKENLVKSLKPTEDLSGLLNSAYGSYMNNVLDERMTQAAIKYADTNAVYKRTESEEGKAKIKYKYDRLIDDYRTQNDMDFEYYKHMLNNNLIDSEMSGLPSAQVSWNKQGVDIQKQIFKDNGYFVTNKQAFDEYNKEYHNKQWGYIESFLLNNPELAAEFTGGQSGQITYTTEKSNGQKETVTTDLATAKNYLVGKGGTGSELSRIYDQLVDLRSGKIPMFDTDQSGNLTNPMQKLPNPMALAYQQMEDDITLLNTMLGEAVLQEAQTINQISKNIYSNAWQKEKTLGIPPISLPEGEYTLLNDHGALITNPTDGSKIFTVDDFLNGRHPNNVTDPITRADINNRDMKYLNRKEYEDMFVNMTRGDDEFQAYLNNPKYIGKKHPELAKGSLRGDYYKLINGKYTFDADKAKKDANKYYEAWKAKINEKALSSMAGPGADIQPFNMRAFLSGSDQGVTESPGGMAYPSYTFDYDHMNKKGSANGSRQLDHLLNLKNTYGDDIIIMEGDASDKGPAMISFRKKDYIKKKGTDPDANNIFNQIMSLKRMTHANHKGLKLSLTYHDFSGTTRLAANNPDNLYSAYVINTLPVSADATGLTDGVQKGGQTITVLVPKQKDNNPYKYSTQLTDAYNIYLNNFGSKEGSVVDGGNYRIIKDSNNNLWSYVNFKSWDDLKGMNISDPVIATNLSEHGLQKRSLKEVIHMINEKLHQRQLENWNARQAWCVKNNCGKN